MLRLFKCALIAVSLIGLSACESKDLRCNLKIREAADVTKEAANLEFNLSRQCFQRSSAQEKLHNITQSITKENFCNPPIHDLNNEAITKITDPSLHQTSPVNGNLITLIPILYPDLETMEITISISDPATRFLGLTTSTADFKSRHIEAIAVTNAGKNTVVDEKSNQLTVSVSCSSQ